MSGWLWGSSKKEEEPVVEADEGDDVDTSKSVASLVGACASSIGGKIWHCSVLWTH